MPIEKTVPATDEALFAAACRQLSAPPDELRPLLVPIEAAHVAPQHVAHHLRNLWSRLQALRNRETELVARATHGGLATALGRAFAHLRRGDGFSPMEAGTAFDAAYRTSTEAASAPDCAASIRAAEADTHALQLDYRRAAALLADAAATPGLDPPGRWKHTLQQAIALEALGRDFGDNGALETAASLLETQALALAPRETCPYDWAATQTHLGDVRLALGQRERGTRLLEAAISAYRAALSLPDQDQTPDARAAAQHGLGVALAALGQRRADPETLEAAIAALRLALELRNAVSMSHDWATTQHALASTLLALGQRTRERTPLKEASEAFKRILNVWTRDKAPLEWAATMDSLGTALRVLGDHRNAPRTYEQAVAAYRSALSERTRTRVPDLWALTQNNLGAALHKLGERARDAASLDAALEAYDNALSEWTRARVPVTWAMTLANRAAARKALAEMLGDIELAHATLADFATVAQVFREASHAQYYELAVEQIALTRKLIDALGADPASPSSEFDNTAAARPF